MLRYQPLDRRGEEFVDHPKRIERRIAELLGQPESNVMLLSAGCETCACETIETSFLIARPPKQPAVVYFEEPPSRITDSAIIRALEGLG